MASNILAIEKKQNQKQNKTKQTNKQKKNKEKKAVNKIFTSSCWLRYQLRYHLVLFRKICRNIFQA